MFFSYQLQYFWLNPSRVHSVDPVVAIDQCLRTLLSCFVCLSYLLFLRVCVSVCLITSCFLSSMVSSHYPDILLPFVSH